MPNNPVPASAEADALASILEKFGPTSISFVARLTGCECEHIYQIVRKFPERFDLVGIDGGVCAYCIAIADKQRPIQFVWKEKTNANP